MVIRVEFDCKNVDWSAVCEIQKMVEMVHFEVDVVRFLLLLSGRENCY
jgi:hypothetical protein